MFLTFIGGVSLCEDPSGLFMALLRLNGGRGAVEERA